MTFHLFLQLWETRLINFVFTEFYVFVAPASLYNLENKFS